MTDLVTIGSSYSFLQEYINLCLKLDKKAFCERLTAPVLLSGEKRESSSFIGKPTNYIMDKRNGSLPSEVVMLDLRLPVYEVRQHSSDSSGYITLGRLQECDLVVSDATVSTRHAVFLKDKKTGRYSVQDLNSKNGTLVNNKPLKSDKAVTLKDKDILAFGHTIFWFLYPAGFYDILKVRFRKF